MLPLGTGRRQLQFSYNLHADATWHTRTIVKFCERPHGGAKRQRIFFFKMTPFLIDLCLQA